MLKKLLEKNTLRIISLASAGFLYALPAQAVEMKGVVGFGFDLGGEKVATATYTDGTTVDVNANQGLTINGGVVLVTGDFETQATVGYKFGGPQAKNGSITWDTVPVELMEFYRTGSIRMGLGFSYQNSPKLVIDIPGTSSTTKYDNALGTVVQVGWAPAGSIYSIDLRYTAIKYKQNSPASTVEKNGNVAGIYMSLYF